MNNIHGKRALSIIMVAVFAVLLMMSTELFHPLYPLESESAAAPMSGSTGGTVRAETRPAGTDQTAETSPPPSRADHSVKTASASTTSREEASSAGMSTFPGDSQPSGESSPDTATSAGHTGASSGTDSATVSGSASSPVHTTKPAATKTAKTKTTSARTTRTRERTTKPPATQPKVKGAIAVTFDDGPSPNTARLLDALKKYNVRATFFLVGNRVNGGKGLIRRMVNEGHEVGNHTFSHPDLRKLSDADVTAQLVRTNRLIAGITGKNPEVMRPPYGAFNSRVTGLAKQQGLALILWSPSPVDWKYRNANYICDYILKNVKAGHTLLLHDTYPTSVDGFLRALPVLIERGYKFVTVSELVDLHPGDVHPSYWRK